MTGNTPEGIYSTMIKLVSECKVEEHVRKFMGLTRERLRLSTSEAQRLLESNLPGERVKSLDGLLIGGPNELYRVLLENSQRELVIKIVNKGAESKHDGYLCAREAFALRTASTSCLPVPSVYGVYPDGENLGRPYFVMDCLSGQPMLLNMKELSGEEIQQIGREVGKAIAGLHEITFGHHGDLPIPKYPLPIPHYKPLIWGFSGSLQEVFTQRVDFVIRLYSEQGILSADDCGVLRKCFQQRGKALLISEQAPSLAHGDLVSKNILISPKGQGWHFMGLVDFDRSLALPPEFDFGVMENRWAVNASDERLKTYQQFKKGFMEGYQPATTLSAGWEARMELFCALESLERIYVRGASAHLSRYLKSARNTG